MFHKVLHVLLLCSVFVSVSVNKYCRRTNSPVLDLEISCQITCSQITEGNPGTYVAQYLEEGICTGTSAGIDLTIQQSTFPNDLLNRNWFSSKYNISNLLMLSTNINKIEYGAFNGFTTLKYLKFEDTVGNLQSIDQGIFESLTSLETLEIVNSLDSPNILYNLTGNNTVVSKKLQTVQLIANNLPYIDSNMLTGLSGIKQLYIGHCKVKNVGISAFSELSSLLQLSLVGNSLETLQEGVFKGLRMGFVAIYLNDNNFTCDCSLLWLQELAREYKIEAKCSFPLEHSDMSIIDVDLCNDPTTVSSTSTVTTTTTEQSTTTTTTATTEQSTTTTTATTEQSTTTTTSNTQSPTTPSTITPSTTKKPNEETIEIECETGEEYSAIYGKSKINNKRSLHKETLTKTLYVLKAMQNGYFPSVFRKTQRGFVLPKPPTYFHIESDGSFAVVDIGDCEDCSLIYMRGYTDEDQIEEEPEIKCLQKLKRKNAIAVTLNIPYTFCLVNSDDGNTVPFTKCTTYTVTSNTFTLVLTFIGLLGFIILVILLMRICFKWKNIQKYCNGRMENFRAKRRARMSNSVYRISQTTI
ncbi:hypothetical protein C0J52_05824 [Blattella germanica]|nr:hypothetical protein C0J52_05824 [Blattella germanica]